MTNNKETVDSLSLVVEEQAELIKELQNDIKAMNESNQQKFEDLSGVENTLEDTDVFPF